MKTGRSLAGPAGLGQFRMESSSTTMDAFRSVQGSEEQLQLESSDPLSAAAETTVVAELGDGG